MKIPFIFIIMIILFINSSLRKLLRKHSKKIHSHSHSNHRHSHSHNKYIGLVNGFLKSFNADTLKEPHHNHEITKCLPAEWRVHHNQVLSNQLLIKQNQVSKEKKFQNEITQQSFIFSKIYSFLGSAFNVLCVIKSKIIDFFVSRSIKFTHRRMFIESSLKIKFTWSFGDMFSTLGSFIKDAAVKIKNGVIKIKNAVVDGVNFVARKVEEIVGFFKSKLESLFEPVVRLFETLKQSFTTVFKDEATKTFNVLKCYLKGGEVLLKVTEFLILIPQLLTLVGWFKFIISIICNFGSLKSAIENLKQAVSDIQNRNEAKGYFHFGGFLGYIVQSFN